MRNGHVRSAITVALLLATTLVASMLATDASAGPSAGGRARPAAIECRAEQGKSQQYDIAVNLDAKPIQKADVLFVFDVTGSMGEELDSAKTQGRALMQYVLDKVAPDARFGVASFCDYPGEYSYPGYSRTYGADADYPWQVNQSISGSIEKANSAIGGLTVHNGEDDPEDYGRVYQECATDPSVGWRDDAKRVVVIFGDAPPHDLSFDGHDYGGDPGRDGVAKTDDDVKFKSAVQKLVDHHVAVLTVDCNGTSDAVSAFKWVVKQTNGQYAKLGEADNLKDVVSAIIRKETQVVDKLEVKVTGAAKDWVKVDPNGVANVKGGSTVKFSTRVSIPSGAPLGTSDAMVHFVADGYEICETQLNILVKGPKRPTGFDPKKDGWGFQNRGSHTSWEAFVDYFGKDLVVSPSGRPYYAAENYYEIWNRVGAGGTCFGLATSAIAAQQKGLAIPGRKSGQALADVAAPSIEGPESGGGMFQRDTLGLFVGDYQARQLDARVELLNDSCDRAQLLSGGLMVKPDPNHVLQVIKDYLDQGQPAIVCIGNYNPSAATEMKRWLGHAIVATDYKPSGAAVKVHVYDSNYPRDDGRWIEFNTDEDSWRYHISDSYGWWSFRLGKEEWHPGLLWGGDWKSMPEAKRKGIGSDCLITCMPVDTVLSPGVAPWNPARLSQEGWATVKSLESLTWLDIEHGLPAPINVGGQTITRVGPYAASTTSSDTPDVAMYVFDDPAGANFALSADASQPGTASVFSQGAYSSLTVQPGQSLTASMKSTGSTTVRASDGASATYSYAVSRESTGASHVVELDLLKAGSGQDQITAESDLGSVQVLKATQSTYRVRVSSIASKVVEYASEDVAAGAGDRQVISVPSWESMDASPPVVLVDRGNDGSVDETIPLHPVRGGIGGGSGGTGGDAAIWIAVLGAVLAGGVGWSVYATRKPAADDDDLLAPMAAPASNKPRALLRLPDGTVLPMAAGTVLLGRSPEADVVLDDPSVSRQHATITFAYGAATIRDEGSTAGTWVNGARVSESELSDGDVVTLGDTSFVFEQSNPAE